MLTFLISQPEALRRAGERHHAGEDQSRQHHAHPQRRLQRSPGGTVAAPTLSDALGGPIIADDQSAKQPGRGTFDTLTGNALQR